MCTSCCVWRATYILATAGIAFPSLNDLVVVLALFSVTHRLAHVHSAGFTLGPDSAEVIRLQRTMAQADEAAPKDKR
jgi:hypothetical protein